MDNDNSQNKLVPIDVFKKILEYFVQHIDYLCGEKNKPVEDGTFEQESQDAGKKKKQKKFEPSKLSFKEKIVKVDQDENFAKSGQGYDNEAIQKQMETYVLSQLGLEYNDDNSKKLNLFSCIGTEQKICISIDASSGFIGGSYLHFVSVSPAGSAGTNINLVFTTEDDNNVITKKFVGLEVGPSNNHPEYVFPKLPFSFDELGIGEDHPSKDQQENCQLFLDYFIKMRSAELARKNNQLITKGYEQLLATHNMILTGAPGTGKTWAAKNIASWIICNKSYEDLTDKVNAGKNVSNKKMFRERCQLVQFHPSYDYTDFVEGLRPTTYDQGTNGIGFKLNDGVFKRFCEKALNDEKSQPYVFIIDEINRGELSKIFGELFYSIDPGYRGPNGAVLTQYANMAEKANEFDKKLGLALDDTVQDKALYENPESLRDPELNAPSKSEKKAEFGHFFVPENVYIIGTMNDIDRSVESMDFAMRRRFSFIEVKANERMDIWTGEDWSDLAAACMVAINNEIDKIPGLSPAYHIGPAYFKRINDYKKDYPDFFMLWDNHLQGILFEYLRGKKDAEGTINTIENAYLKAMVKAFKGRFNVSGKWGEALIKNLSSAKSINTTIVDDKSAKDFLGKVKKRIKFADDRLSNSNYRKGEINKMHLIIERYMVIGKKIMELPQKILK